MHEFHLMRRIVELVEEVAAQQDGGWPVRIRLRVSPYSHFAEHSLSDLQALFQIAAQGTIARHATLAILPMADESPCPHCGQAIQHPTHQTACPTCGMERVPNECGAEMLIQDIEWQDQPER